MYRIAVLSGNQTGEQQLAHWIREFCGANGIFPRIDVYEDMEQFYRDWKIKSPCAVIVDLPGVAGLNEVEHIRSLCRECGLIWCSDLDFSLQAFRLRVDYFLLAPITEPALREGISLWIGRRGCNRRNPELISI